MPLTDAEKAAKRAEIMKRVAEARAAQEAKAKAVAEPPNPKLFGTHTDITCDGCNVEPIVGFRWRCKNCKNHDLCGTCHAQFLEGKLVHNNRRNNVSMRVQDHEFFAWKDQKGFKGMKMNGEVIEEKQKKTKPNEPCPCGSGKKYKKCCRPKDMASGIC
jgi:hypothetical protein